MMYYSNDYLCHYGVLGMKWGQHIAAKAKSASDKYYARKAKKYAQSENDRRTRIFETKRGQSMHVASEQREATNRIKYYGGTTAAKSAIAEETSMKIAKTVIKGTAGTTAAYIGAAALGATIGTVSGVALVGATATGIAAGAKLSRGIRQYTYTKDQDHKKIKMVD